MSDIGWLLKGLLLVGLPLGALSLLAWWRGRRQGALPIDGDRLAARAVLTGVVLLAAATVYQALYRTGYQHTSLMFVGLPALIAFGVIFTRRHEHPYRSVLIGQGMFLLLSALVLGEGLICVLVAAPVFFSVGAFVVFAMRRAHAHGRWPSRALVAPLLILVASLEGALPIDGFERDRSVTVSKVIALPVDEIRGNLARHPDFSRLPLTLLGAVGFPVPVAAIGTGLSAGDTREFVFRRADGVDERVVFRVWRDDVRSTSLEPLVDETVIARWLRWRGTRFDWEPLGAASTRVTVTMSYRRMLDPIWYFGPLQRVVVGRAARVLLAHASQSSATAVTYGMSQSCSSAGTRPTTAGQLCVGSSGSSTESTTGTVRAASVTAVDAPRPSAGL